ncbi:DNA repair protein RadA [Candidatus Synechococcus calcipolaris G9]|uniref:DNA repair protein RadA n=1 Tax=Candidatus Synechococcus calcipolaris G9 TaxID=1497997 RepID=A0ABT6EXJ0_9SYNE|nr:DNA repair protein RadA [Candidatus Synechococcus calcipolaris]MDG2990082.1 DNA repair protein RadA [Candidatus Synechococcus calcipolaris G9]
MPKPRTLYICRECGAESVQYFGRCASCGAWNSLDEQIISGATAGEDRLLGRSRDKKNKEPEATAAVTLGAIAENQQFRLSSGFSELDRVLGGGIVPGSLVLVGGDPGIGKSTLLLQVAATLAQQERILYVCAEESGQQVKLRSRRLKLPQSAQLYLLPEIDLEVILQELRSLQPSIAVIDSIQAIYLASLTSAPGSVSQVRECTSALMRLAKQDEISLFIVGHVTKEGAIAGPKVLEHLVDTVLYFEGDRFASHRLLRVVKNRFGATQEIGVFEMVDRGLEQVTNPSALFLGESDPAPGTAVIVACEGTRPLVVELQALVSPTSYPSPRRSTTGLEYNRFLQILAVLEKRLGVPLSKLDAYVSSSGGLTVAEPAADLGVAVAVVASFRDRLVQSGTVMIGEVGLGGQVRSVSQLETRLREALKLGFKRAIVPKSQDLDIPGLEICPVGRVADAIVAALAPMDQGEHA